MDASPTLNKTPGANAGCRNRSSGLALALSASQLFHFALRGSAWHGALAERLRGFGLLAGGALRLFTFNFVGDALRIHASSMSPLWMSVIRVKESTGFVMVYSFSKGTFMMGYRFQSL